jgi:hypothetical protein
MRASRTWGLAAALLGLAACGGSGGGGGGGALDGEFHAVRFRASTPVTASAFWGPATSDDDLLEFTFDRNVNGSLGASAEEFDVSESGGNLFLEDTASGEAIHEGSLAAGGNVFVAGSVRSGDLPEIFAMTRRGSGASDDDLSGEYHAVVFRFDGSGVSTVGTASFDGAGSGSLLPGALTNTDGAIGAALAPAPMTYSVALDGEVDFAFTFGAAFEGGLDPSGTIALTAGSTAAGEDPQVFFLLKDATSASDATFSGDYRIVVLSYDVSEDDFLSFTGTLAADGAGNATMQGTVNRDGVLSTLSSEAFTYSVAPDGTVSLFNPAGTLSGGIDQTGTFVVLGGMTTVGGDPTLMVLVRP